MDLSVAATHDSSSKRSRKDGGDDVSSSTGISSTGHKASSTTSSTLPPAPPVPVPVHPGGHPHDLSRCLSDPHADRMMMEEVAFTEEGDPQNNALDLTSHHGVGPPLAEVSSTSVNSLPTVKISDIQLKRILNEDPRAKTISYEGEILCTPAVVVLEKTPLSESSVRSINIEAAKSHNLLTREMSNDIYGKYVLNPPPTCQEVNSIRVTVIHPATSKHIEKYSKKEVRIVEETPEDYLTKTLPMVVKDSHSLEWVYNIIEHKSEVERIVFEDPDPETGFILLPDFKWDQINTSDLYLMAIVNKRGIASIRDLRPSHIPLLENVYEKGVQAIKAKYGLERSQLRVYLHYRPSYYHLHVHFTSTTFEAPGTSAERAHLISTVISNLKLLPTYYETATLSFPVYDNEPLYGTYIGPSGGGGGGGGGAGAGGTAS